MNTNVAQRSVAIQDVNRGLTEIRNGPTGTNNSSRKVNQGADELSKPAEQLSSLVGRFKEALRKAIAQELTNVPVLKRRTAPRTGFVIDSLLKRVDDKAMFS